MTELLSEQLLHCSFLNELNDPWEGTFVHTFMEDEYRNGITATKQRTETKSIYDFPEIEKYRICCLTSEHRNRLLWSYYADSFRGFCVEIDFDDELFSKRTKKIEKINKVTYNGFLFYRNSFMNENFEFINKPPSQQTIINLISNKSKDWKHEKEYRIVTLKEKYSVEGKIRRIFVGARADDLTKIAIKKIAGNIPVIILRLRNNWKDQKSSTMWDEEPI